MSEYNRTENGMNHPFGDPRRKAAQHLTPEQLSDIRRQGWIRTTGGEYKRATYLKQNGRHVHRIIAEESLGRALLPGEIVHHINGDFRDNRPENLAVMTQSEHCRIHMTKHKGGDAK